MRWIGQDRTHLFGHRMKLVKTGPDDLIGRETWHYVAKTVLMCGKHPMRGGVDVDDPQITVHDMQRRRRGVKGRTFVRPIACAAGGLCQCVPKRQQGPRHASDLVAACRRRDRIGIIAGGDRFHLLSGTFKGARQIARHQKDDQSHDG